MRGSHFAILVAFAIALPSATAPSFAQSGERRATAPSQQGQSLTVTQSAMVFRPRLPEERLATLRRLSTEQARRAAPNTRLRVQEIGTDQLGTPFVLTPRQPYDAQHGSMSALHVTMLSTKDSGVLFFQGDDPPPPEAFVSLGQSLVILDLSHAVTSPNQHMLIECTVDGHSGPYSAQIVGNSASWSDTSASYNGVISFFTPVFPSGELQVRIRPVAIGPGVSWTLSGCEVGYVLS